MFKKPPPRARRSKSDAVDALRARHLRREVKTALELAVAALAHSEVIDQLATAAGLLEALAEFPPDSAPVLATMPRAMLLAENALETWRNWHAKPARKAFA